jgi:hypothetical protein
LAIESYGPATRTTLLAPAQRLPRFPQPSINLSVWTSRILVAWLVVCLVSSLGWALHRQEDLQDLGSFLHSGASYRQHLDPYTYHPIVDPQPISPDALNLNPPISVYAFAAISPLDPQVTSRLLFLGTVAFFAVALYMLMRAYPDKRDPLVLLAVCSLAGVWHTLGYLQIYAPLILGVIAAWLLLRRGDLLMAGLIIGLIVAVKPNFVLWPLLLLVAGQPRVAFAAFASASAVSVIPLIVDGPEIYLQWLNVSMAFSGVEWSSNAALASVGARFGSEPVGFVLGAIVVLGLAFWFLRSRPQVLTASALSIAAVLLAGPVSWAGYTLFLAPYLFSRPWTRLVWASLLLLATPFWLVRYFTMLGPVSNALLGSIYAWGVLLLFAVIVWEQVHASRQDESAEEQVAA